MSIADLLGDIDAGNGAFLNRTARERAGLVRRAVGAATTPVAVLSHRLAEGARRASRRRAAVRTLAALDDDTLRDIGLVRADIDDVGETVGRGRVNIETALWAQRLKASPTRVQTSI